MGKISVNNKILIGNLRTDKYGDLRNLTWISIFDKG